MSTLADELLNDFEDSGSEAEEEQQAEAAQDGSLVPSLSGPAQNGGMILDDDEEEEDGEDEEAIAAATSKDAVAEAEDEEETKAKVEKMQLGGVSDVRSVASLMKTLEPVLEVRVPFH